MPQPLRPLQRIDRRIDAHGDALTGSGAWGQRATDHTIKLIFADCASMRRIYITGVSGDVNAVVNESAVAEGDEYELPIPVFPDGSGSATAPAAPIMLAMLAGAGIFAGAAAVKRK